MAKTYYDILDVAPTATAEEIEQSYHLLRARWQPDKFRGPVKKLAEERLQEIEQAYAVLSDPQKRAAYVGGLAQRPRAEAERQQDNQLQAQEAEQKPEVAAQAAEEAEARGGEEEKLGAPPTPLPPSTTGAKNGEKRRRVLLWVLAAAGLLAVALVGLIVWSPWDNTLLVPDLVGQKASVARRAVGDDFALKASNTKDSGDPKDTVLSQDPKPGERAPQGSTIFVVTSAGLPIPNLVGQTESAAKQAAGNDFKIDASSERSSHKPKGTILSQDPEPGERVQQGSSISVVTSAGDIMFQDDFSDTSSGWPRGNKDQFGGSGDYDTSKGTYRITPGRPGSFHLDWPAKIGNIANAKVAVDATRIGDASSRWGVICRKSSSASNHYALAITSEGVPVIFKNKNGQPSVLSRDTTTKVDPSATNRIRGDCVGDKLTLYVNDQKLLETSDNEFTSGLVGLVAGTEVSFDNFSVSKP